MRGTTGTRMGLEASFHHLNVKHSVKFEEMMAAHGNGTEMLYCGHCRKPLYRPPRKFRERSDKPVKLPEAA
jgi:hypothetical protein